MFIMCGRHMSNTFITFLLLELQIKMIQNSFIEKINSLIEKEQYSMNLTVLFIK